MSTTTIDARPVRRSTPEALAAGAGVTPARTGSPKRRLGPGVRPAAKPPEGAPSPRLRRATAAAPSGCLVPGSIVPGRIVPGRIAPAATPARPLAAPRGGRRATLRLTDRGIAAVLVVGLMIVVAAVTVVGATASHVTSAHYQSQFSLSR